MSELSTTAASNNPPGSDAPSTIDDQIRALAAIVRQNVTKGSDIASASAITIPASGNYFVVTGTTGITSITDTNSWYGREVVLKFSGALTITHSANLILPGAANITTAAGDVAHFVSESSGVWRCSSYTKYSGTYAILGANTFTGIQTHSAQVRWSKGADVASANALTLGTDGNYFDITGTTAITSIGTLGVGTQVKLHFDGALTLTHHATDLILPGGANITTAAGDEIELVEYATGDWRMVGGVKADGTAWVVTANTGSTTFLGANVNLNNTATYFSGPNTGSIGASGQTWLIIAVGCAYNTSGASKFCMRIYDGAAAHADTESTSLSINAAVNMTATAIVTLSGATTFTLQMKDALSTSGVLLTTGPNCASANKATSITAVRLS